MRNIRNKYSDNIYSFVPAIVFLGIVFVATFLLLTGAGNENVKPYSIGKSNDGVFEAYTFRHNQHRCFVVTTKENLIDLECP